MKKLRNLCILFLLVVSGISFAQSNDPDFFPIAVWLQSPVNAMDYKEQAGINMFIGLYKDLDQAQFDDLKNAGMKVICRQNSFGLAHKSDSIIYAWSIQKDEPDNAQWNSTTKSYDPCVNPSTIIYYYKSIKKNDPSRPVYLNLGRGVADITWGGRGSCTGNYQLYIEETDGYLAACDIASFDIYPVNSTESATKEKLWYVPKGIDSLKAWAAEPKPTWTWIETTKIDTSNNRAPTPAEVKSEVWMAIIHGANGIGYFCHILGPTFDEAGLLHDEEMLSNVAEINQTIKDLAPVLNSPTIPDFTNISSSNPDVPINIMTKYYGDYNYIFAVSMRPGSTVATFSIPEGETIEVVGEDRTIQESGGQFTDDFSEYGVHIYKISPVVSTSATTTVPDDFKIFPNPSTGIINIPDEFTNSAYEIISVNGQMLLKGKAASNHIDLSNINIGLYFMKIIENKTGNQHVFKIVKKN